jgi:hypothetical protein
MWMRTNVRAIADRTVVARVVRLGSLRRQVALDLAADRAEIMDRIRGLDSNYCVSSSAGMSRRPQRISVFRYDYEREFPITL